MVILAMMGKLVRGEVPGWLRNIDETWNLKKCFENLL